jgi:hypothetical protein
VLRLRVRVRCSGVKVLRVTVRRGAQNAQGCSEVQVLRVLRVLRVLQGQGAQGGVRGAQGPRCSGSGCTGSGLRVLRLTKRFKDVKTDDIPIDINILKQHQGLVVLVVSIMILIIFRC